MNELLQEINAKLDALLAARPGRRFEPDALYTLAEAAQVIGCDSSGLRRAACAGYLKTMDTPVGRQAFGRDVLAWMQAGSKTGRNKGNVQATMRKVA